MDTLEHIYTLGEDYLEHHGILGMKWGVRRYQPYPADKHGTFLGQSRDEDIRVKKGSTAFRLQATPDINPNSEHIYMSLQALGHMKYISAFSSGDSGVAIDAEVQEDGKQEPYSVKLKLQKDIVAPSYNKTMETFIETISQMQTKRRIPASKLREVGEEGVDFIKKWNKTKSQDALDEAYRLFARSMMYDNKARRLFFDSLRKQGYNAIIDEADQHFGDEPFSKSAVILFDKSAIKKVGAKKVKDSDQQRDKFEPYEIWEDYNPGEDFAKEYLKIQKMDDWAKWLGYKK